MIFTRTYNSLQSRNRQHNSSILTKLALTQRIKKKQWLVFGGFHRECILTTVAQAVTPATTFSASRITVAGMLDTNAH